MSTICWSCGQKITKELIENRKKKKSFNIKKAMALSKKNGIKIGRPRILDYQKVYALDDKGLSLGEISEKLKVSRGMVQYALSLR